VKYIRLVTFVVILGKRKKLV